MFSKGFTRFL